MLCDGFFYFLMSIPLLFNCLSMLCYIIICSFHLVSSRLVLSFLSCLVYGIDVDNCLLFSFSLSLLQNGAERSGLA